LQRGDEKILLVERQNSGILWTEPKDISYEEAMKGVEAFKPPNGESVRFICPSGRRGSFEDSQIHLQMIHRAEKHGVSEWLKIDGSDSDDIEDELQDSFPEDSTAVLPYATRGSNGRSHH